MAISGVGGSRPSLDPSADVSSRKIQKPDDDNSIKAAVKAKQDKDNDNDKKVNDQDSDNKKQEAAAQDTQISLKV